MSRRVQLEEGVEYTRYSLRYVKTSLMQRVRILNAQHPTRFPTIENVMNKALEVGVKVIEQHFQKQPEQTSEQQPNNGLDEGVAD